ncbi:hypothetical protein FZI85_19065 [Mycobacterium sp. CBMA293]|uniref:hypothetical protein n=1 Tax=unclassified Mycolicibacterium TaxID=2636767 RepID=UPI0012DDD332|nr:MULTISPECIES: hypothetical protein [unclassified Mycolicibacterium]MUL49183.1 hypothetical protein [Mycolicibacterium sp. CBMA 360]MUL60785.1 hypothetical protein [Mycolicibacterium sp. CBMA 335]MUL71798.1 hypothetical protein [Mycolicibacterium sp. CBMA 311]MUL95726.1 hypothetical protein [Mycolicibacterium sp. CBMA 230]MUM03532.1 hypothetical protein [Mycolicibacterium sp. CBMA 213]
MQIAVRPRLGAGIALVGAGAIALAPISPVAPAGLHLLPVRASVPVEFTAAINPIQAYFDLVGNTAASIEAQVQTFSQGLGPSLQLAVAHALAGGATLLSAFGAAGGLLASNLATIVPQELQQAFANLAAGDIVGVGNDLTAIIVQPVLGPVIDVLSAVQPMLSQSAANMLAVTQQFVTIGALAGIGLLEPVVTTINGTALAIQNVVDALRAGDPIGAVGAVLAAPAVIVNTILNGNGSGDGGLFGPGISTVGSLQSIGNIIATAFATTPAPVAATLAAAAPAASVPSAVTPSTQPVTAPQKSALVKAVPLAVAAAAPATNQPSTTSVGGITTKVATEVSPVNGSAAGGVPATKAGNDADSTSNSKNGTAKNGDAKKGTAKNGTGAAAGTGGTAKAGKGVR